MVVPVPIIAAGVTAAGSLLSAWLASRNNKEGKVKQTSTLSKEQKQINKLIKQGLEKGTGPYGELFGEFKPEDFEKGVAKPQLKKFQEETLPMLQEKYIANNQVLGTGFQRAKTRAATDFQSKLAEQMYGAKQAQNANRIAGLNALTGRQTVENLYQPGQPSGWNEVTKNIGDNSDTYTKVIEEAIKSSQEKNKGQAAGTQPVQAETSAVAGGV